MSLTLADFPAPPAVPSAGQLAEAEHLALVCVAGTDAARALVDDLCARIAPHVDAGRGNKRRAAGEAKVRAAVAAVVGGVLRRWGGGEPRLAFRSLSADAFTGSPIGRRQFGPVVGALSDLGLLARHGGISFPLGEWEDGTPWFDRRAARFWPTADLLSLAARHGIRRDALRDHFRPVPPAKAPVVKDPIGLKSFELDKRGRPAAPRPLRIAAGDAEAARIRADVERHNAFAAGVAVEGCTPPRWRRVFRGGWAMGGRWYAAGSDGAYQTMPAADRLRALRIAGEPVAEIDVKGAHLALLCGLAGRPMPAGDDPYAVEGVPRDVVKAWVTATLGKGSPVRRWSERAPAGCAVHDPKAIGAAIVARIPALAEPAAVVPTRLADRFGGDPRPILTHYLMGLEAWAVTLALTALREVRGVLALPMHDALTVPAAAVDHATAALTDAFEEVAGIVPGLAVRSVEAVAA